LLFQPPTFFASLSEASTENLDGVDTFYQALLDDSWNRRSRGGNGGKFYRLRDISHAGVCPDAENLAFLRIYGIELARVAEG
jgi:hypothetical protein